MASKTLSKIKAKSKRYVVWIGRKPGIYKTWDECKAQIDKYPKAAFKSFPNEILAIAAYQSRAIAKRTSKKQAIASTMHKNCICVDGAWNTVTGQIEYQGVLLPIRDKIFSSGVLEHGTNNIAEFLAVVHALAYCKANGIDAPIYTDSVTALSWVRKKKAATKIIPLENNEHVRSLISRAELWLSLNIYNNPVLKWETKQWGENPADFGRK